MSDEQQFFNPILENDKISILEHIRNNDTECVIKVFDSVWKTHFIKTTKNNIQVLKKNFIKLDNEKIIVSFESVGDQYFFESIIESSEAQIIIKTPEKVFKLQRRNDFRVTIPSTIKPILKLKKYPDLKAEIRDMSLGGCKIAIKTEFELELSLNTEIEMQIKILEFEEKKLYAQIKFVDFKAAAKTLILGLQFTELTSDQITLIRTTLLQIDRILRQKSQD